MAVASPQSSRGALVTWVVILAILFVVATVLAFYANAERQRAAKEAEELRAKFIPVVVKSDSARTTAIAEYDRLHEDQRFNVTKADSLIDKIAAQRDALSKRITGAVQDAGAALTAAQDAVDAAANAVKAAGASEPVPTDSLVAAISSLSQMVASRQQEVTTLKQQLIAAQQETANALKQIQDLNSAHAAAVEEIRSKSASDVEAAARDLQATRQTVSEVEESAKTTLESANQQVAQLSEQVRRRDEQIKELETIIDRLQNRLREGRTPTQGPIMQQADGRIVRTPGNNIVFIDLGQGDQISPGMTFEVYDKIEGLPAWKGGDDEGADDQYAGKASIEVTRVGATSSEARVVKVRPGENITEGDLLVNLVYDPNVKYKFVVHGEFDLDNNGVATANDAEVIKRLVTDWGASLMNQVTVDTDFLVLGKEPVIPTFPPEEENDPINVDRVNQAKAALQAYQDIRAQANELNIPILNQNRFLYFVGYFDLARR
jgi:hypothetical protein